jgi:hypothetical protein
MVIADVHGGLVPNAPDGTIDDVIAGGHVIDDRDAAILLAASPDLYRACTTAYRELSRVHGDAHPIVRTLVIALERAHGLRMRRK